MKVLKSSRSFNSQPAPVEMCQSVLLGGGWRVDERTFGGIQAVNLVFGVGLGWSAVQIATKCPQFSYILRNLFQLSCGVAGTLCFQGLGLNWKCLKFVSERLQWIYLEDSVSRPSCFLSEEVSFV